MKPQMYQELRAHEEKHWWFLGRRAIIREVLLRRLGPARGRKILDIGCGTGGMLEMLRELGEVEGLDPSEQAIELARQRFGPQVPLWRGELPDGVPPDRRYHLITAFDVLEHMADPVRVLSAARPLLQPEGALVCSVPAHQFLWSQHDEANLHQRRYSMSLLEQHLGAAGFQLSWSSYYNALLFPPVAAVRLARRLIPEREGSDLSHLPPALNRLLLALFSAERHLLARARLPFGISILALARPSPEV